MLKYCSNFIFYIFKSKTFYFCVQKFDKNIKMFSFVLFKLLLIVIINNSTILANVSTSKFDKDPSDSKSQILLFVIYDNSTENTSTKVSNGHNPHLWILFGLTVLILCVISSAFFVCKTETGTKKEQPPKKKMNAETLVP